jgi:hypothetical protein
MGTGVAVFITELWRDGEGRGMLLGGALDGPQAAAIVLVLAGGLVLMERARPVEDSGFPPFRQTGAPSARTLRAGVEKEGERMGHGTSEGPGVKGEAANG